jgi:hypothetical protein
MILPSRQRTYYGFDDGFGGALVFVSRAGQPLEQLPLRCDIINHSPTGFAWGYSGSGPAQLALAILADYFECAQAARALHQHFKFAAIAGIREKHWSMTEVDLVIALHKISRCRPWLERMAIFDKGPTVQIVDHYAEHAGGTGTLLAVIPHDDCEVNDELVLLLDNAGEVVLCRDQISVVPLADTP